MQLPEGDLINVVNPFFDVMFPLISGIPYEAIFETNTEKLRTKAAELGSSDEELQKAIDFVNGFSIGFAASLQKIKNEVIEKFDEQQQQQ